MRSPLKREEATRFLPFFGWFSGYGGNRVKRIFHLSFANTDNLPGHFQKKPVSFDEISLFAFYAFKLINWHHQLLHHSNLKLCTNLRHLKDYTAPLMFLVLWQETHPCSENPCWFVESEVYITAMIYIWFGMYNRKYPVRIPYTDNCPNLFWILILRFMVKAIGTVWGLHHCLIELYSCPFPTKFIYYL